MNSEHERESEKPPFFYHASPNREIARFEPRAESVRDENEGPVVFATPDKGLASVFMMKHDDSWTASGRMGETPFFLYSDEEKLRANDRGGSLYLLPAESFNQDGNDGHHRSEWTSRTPVDPIEKTDYDSALDAMRENGVEVHHVDQATLERFQAAPPDEKALLLEQLRSNQ